MKTYKTKSGKTYTKKQICEAINFWKKQLKRLNEDYRQGIDIKYVDDDNDKADIINNPNMFPLRICAYDVRFKESIIYLASKKTPKTIWDAIGWALEHFYNCDDWYNEVEYIHPKTHALEDMLDRDTIKYLYNQLMRKGLARLEVVSDEYGNIPLELTFATPDAMRRSKLSFVIID